MDYLYYINQTFAELLNFQIYQAETPTQFTQDTFGLVSFSWSVQSLALDWRHRTQIVASQPKSRKFNA